MRRRQAMLDGMNKRYDGDNALWAYVRSRLEVTTSALTRDFTCTRIPQFRITLNGTILSSTSNASTYTSSLQFAANPCASQSVVTL